MANLKQSDEELRVALMHGADESSARLREALDQRFEEALQDRHTAKALGSSIPEALLSQAEIAIVKDVTVPHTGCDQELVELVGRTSGGHQIVIQTHSYSNPKLKPGSYRVLVFFLPLPGKNG